MSSTTIPADFRGLKRCRHKHQLHGSGAVFLQSVGWLICARCGGYQKIRKPIT